MQRQIRTAFISMIASVSFIASAQAAEQIKVGFPSTFSGPFGTIGQNLRDGFTLGVEHLGGKLGGLPTEILIEDDGGQTDNTRQIVDKFIEHNKVDVITGIVATNTLMAVAAPILRSKTVLISANAGPSPLAGAQCSEYFFSTSWQGDNFAEALGTYLQEKNVNDIYLMAPNYGAGKDVISGFKRFFKGKIAGEVYTPLNQLDFAAELAQLRAAKPAAVFAFYPGGLGVQFLQQYAQAGLKDQFTLYTAYTLDSTSLPAIGEAAMGTLTANMWNIHMDNPANKKFVQAFVEKYKRNPPFYAAQAYDAAFLIDSAVKKVSGKIENKEAFLAALKEANFNSVRGSFKLNTNHFPIQNFYLEKVVRGADGKPDLELGPVIIKDHKDAYASQCRLK